MRSNPQVIKSSRNRKKEGQSQPVRKQMRRPIWKVSPPSRLPGHVGGAGAAPQRQPQGCTMLQVTAQNSKGSVVPPRAGKSVSLFLKKRGDQRDPAHLLSLLSFGDSGEEHASSLLQLLAEFSSCGCRTGFTFPFWLSAWSCSQPWKLPVFLPLGPPHLQSQQRSTSTLKLPELPISDLLLFCHQPERIYHF